MTSMLYKCCAALQLRENYLKSEPMETREETYAAIKKALATLEDPFTRLLEPARFKALQRGTAGSVTGVGLEVGFVNEGSADSELVVSSWHHVTIDGRSTTIMCYTYCIGYMSASIVLAWKHGLDWH